MEHTSQEPWDEIFDFNHYRISVVRKIITRWRRIKNNNERRSYRV
jgi:hypothetical protein